MQKKQYRISSRKSIKTQFILMLLILIVIVFSGTISSYLNGAVGNNLINIAKWSIVINGEQITSNSTELSNSINLYNVNDNTTIIDSGDDCYFDIIVNPTQTEVAIAYSIDIDLANSNLPNGTKIYRYEVFGNTGENEVLLDTEDIDLTILSLEDEIYLQQGNQFLNNSSIRRFRVYCRIPFPADIVKENGFSIEPQVSVSQLIDE